MLLLTAPSAIAQDAATKPYSAKSDIPFGKKLPPPDVSNERGESLAPIMSPNINNVLKLNSNHQRINSINKNINEYRQQFFQNINEKSRNEQTFHASENAIAARSNRSNSCTTVSGFHLTKDINALAESNPRNNPSLLTDIHFDIYNDSTSYAVLDSVVYFVADDGIHGDELWRSDGTAAGTYMVKDIAPGVNSSRIFDITAVNGKIYFTDYDYIASGKGPGYGAWISDGTESGTQLLINVGEPVKYFSMGNKVYFITDDDIGNQWSVIWETDGTTAGTKRLITLEKTGAWISEPTVVNGLFFFTMYTYETDGWNLWRSDGTEAGTYSIASFHNYNNIPAQFTNYNNKLYFSASDGTGRKLWVSDGSDAGTKPAPGNHDVLVGADKLGTTFPIINNVLYIPGEEASKGNGLYKYDASDAAGLVKIKDLAPDGDTAFIVPFEMQVVNKTLYFKVINYTGGIHDELWSSKGTKSSTRLVYKLLPGETIKNLFNGSGTFYFVKYDKLLGAELWRTFETPFGSFPIPVSDIFKGPTGSYPSYLTAFNGKLIFSAADKQKGNELFITDGDFFNTTLVKDINTVATTSSRAGFNSYTAYGGMTALGKDVLFNAYDRVHGYELYKSDGTAAGTELLNDVVPGEAGVFIHDFLSKNDAVYFLAVSSSNNSLYNSNNRYSIYKTKGTKNSLRKITPDYNFIQSFSVADNGVVFYVSYKYNPSDNTSAYELWRTDSTATQTFLLSSTLSNSNYLNVIGNTALFVASDSVHGYELWKSDGSLAGTKIVKDINPGIGNSMPKGMFIYKNEVYFAAYDGVRNSFWKSNGTKSGTIKVKEIDPYWNYTVTSTARYNFEISNNILYFAAIDTSNLKGAQIWKTDGTTAGTQVVKDINPTATSNYPNPSYFTDVNGTVFFVGDDGVHGAELWKTDGTKEGTKLVQDITPGIDGSNLNGLTSFGGKLFFQNAHDGWYYLWTSDGTPEGTHEVQDPGILNVKIANGAIFASDNKLFLTGVTYNYGLELYVGSAIANKAPAISLTIPYNIVKYSAPARIKLNAAAADEDGKITKVQFFNGTTRLHTEDAAPYGFLWIDVPTGNYTLTAKAFDDCGNVTTSNSINVSVVAENVPPVVSIVSPVNDTTYTGPATIRLIAEAKDPNDKISKVEFYSGTTLIRTEHYYPYTYTWTNVQAGTYTITAKAYDDKGLSATSDPVTVTVTASSLPIVSSRPSSVNSKAGVKDAVSLNLYPNPVKNVLNVKIASSPNDKVTLLVTDITGRTIINKATNAGGGERVIQMNVRHLSAGTYFLKAICGSGCESAVKKFEKQ